MTVPYLRGADLSHYEDGIDWTKLALEIQFMMTKATDGQSGVDILRAKHVANAKANGVLVVGVYHFFRANYSVANQVELFLANGGDAGIPILDLEEASTMGQPLATVSQLAGEWLALVEARSGKVPLIYGNTSYLNSLNLHSGFGNYPLWLANLNLVPTIPHPWTKWTFWQYSFSGNRDAKPGGMDTDYFNGTMSDLRLFCGV